ncbi:MAG: helix-turn-helix transcriptional regulator [Bacteroidota bacterium]|uniref:Helix-turn-helix transcriptional regulator n=1 Tax=Pedobacter cryotolerans TaxID=2571270 RepID=A0A4U1C7Q2_9SPHI|nr:helix-turn-helix transcriptional regulator [Pedobacter cryotolerans]TKC01417.1 helix-turn-helix transcriptional regulator [Pedobacter cryotolerans]
MNTTSKTSEEIQNSFNEILSISSEQERLELEAQSLAFSFLAEIDKAMSEQKMSKKALAESIGTSASYITQLFRGDRLPNFINLAKMKEALGMEFDIEVRDKHTTEEKSFDFPEIKPKGWHYYKFETDYQTPQAEYGDVQYDETQAA